MRPARPSRGAARRPRRSLRAASSARCAMTTASVVVPVKDGGALPRGAARGRRPRGRPTRCSSSTRARATARVAIARAAGAERAGDPGLASSATAARATSARSARAGELIGFLTQDATPVPGWLDALPRGVRARRARRRGVRAAPAARRHVADDRARARRSSSPASRPTAAGRPARAADDPSFLSNVNARLPARRAGRRSASARSRYSEDQAFGRDLLDAGGVKVYHPGAAVLHAHDYRWRGSCAATSTSTAGCARRSATSSRSACARRRATCGARGRRPRVDARAGLGRPPARALDRALGRPSRRPQGVLRARLARATRCLRRCSGRCRSRARAAASPAAAAPAGPAVPRDPAVAQARARVRRRPALAAEGTVPLLDPVPGMADREPLHIACDPAASGAAAAATTRSSRSVAPRAHRPHCSMWHHRPDGLAARAAAVVRDSIREYFAPIEAPVFKGFDDWFGADIVLATGWQTVLRSLLLLDAVRARGYVVNDHEPEFYATSDEAHWARLSYAHGLLHLRSPWLADIVRDRYGARRRCSSSASTTTSTTRARSTAGATRSSSTRADVRRGAPTPLGVQALGELHRRRPDVRILLFGDIQTRSRAVPVRAPRDRLARAARVAVLRGDRRPVACR